MAGLFKKAEQLRDEIHHSNTDSLHDLDTVVDIPESERAEIVEWIDKRLAKTRESVSIDRFRLEIDRNGLKFPLVVNAVAALLIAAGTIFFIFFYRSEEADFLSPDGNKALVQNEVFQVLKAEGERKLAEKENEIGIVRERLNQAVAERERLKQDTETLLGIREKRIREEYSQASSALAERLESEGQSEEDVARQIKELEERNITEIERALEEMKAEVEAEYRAREQLIAREEAESKRALADAEDELLSIQSAAQARVADLEGRQVEAMGRIGNAVGGLSNDVASISSLIRASDYGGALSRIADIQNRPVAPPDGDVNLQIVSETRELIVDTLQTLIDSYLSFQETTGKEIASNAVIDKLAALELPTLRAEGYRQAGRIEEALESYSASLSGLPSMKVAHDRLLEAKLAEERSSARDRERQLEEINSVNISQLAARDSQILDLESANAGLRGRLAAADERVSSLERSADDYLLERDLVYGAVAALRRAIISDLDEVEKREKAKESDLLKMLQAKLTFKKILSDDPISAEYPELAEYLDTYYDMVGTEAEIKSEIATLTKAIESLQAVINGTAVTW